MRKKDNEELIAKCKEVHEDKYDYSKFDFINSRTKVCIICPEHGEFWQLYHNHIKGCGCQECGGNKRLTNEEYVNTLKRICVEDNIRFDKVQYVNNHTPITLECIKHGEWNILPTSILDRVECPECQRERLRALFSMDTDNFIQKAEEIHGKKYDYSKVDYVNNKTKVCIICPEHGEFWQIPNQHLAGNGCPKCGSIKMWDKRGRMNTEKIVNKFKEVHGDKYDYSKVMYHSPKDKVEIVCPNHGVFTQLPYAHLNGSGCPKCGKEKIAKCFAKTKEEFIAEATSVHGNYFDYSRVNYVNLKTKVDITCPKHGPFSQSPSSHLKGTKCPMCYAELSVSANEMQLRDCVKRFCEGEIIRHNARNIIPPLEIDMVNTVRKIGVEYDGLYWHSDEKLTDYKYHLNKTNLCKEHGYRLVHIFEDEWVYKTEIVKSRLENIFGKTPIRIGARKCEIREMSSNETKRFLEENHIQGNVNSSIRYGLFYQDEVVAVMTFGQLRKNLGSVSTEGNYELVRFCNKLHTNVIGGASKLLKHFIREYNPQRIISYADKRWSDGNMYLKLGFVHVRDSKPSYFYTLHGKTRENRFKYRKDVLVKEGYDKNKSEAQIMKERGYFKIYDCGCMVFEWMNQ